MIEKKYGFNPATNARKRKNMMKLLKRKVVLYGERKTELSRNELKDYKTTLENLAQLERIDRAETDVLFFAFEYFSEERNPGNPDNLIPENVMIHDTPDFHKDLCDMLNTVSTEKVNAKIAWASPRGSGKSAYLSNIFPVHQVVFGKRKYIISISETESISQKFIEFVADSLRYNEKLREDFGELLSPKKQANEIDNLSMFRTTTGILVEASSLLSQLRGKRSKGNRPDCILLDDCESLRTTNTAELREKNLHWFSSVIEPLGSPDKTAIIVIGTAVQKDCMLFQLMKRADFESRLYSAIEQEPERMDLWSELENILRDSNNENPIQAAREFYEANKEAMDKGVKVLWEKRWSYFDLMVMKSQMTTRAYRGEYENNPRTEEEMVFNPAEFFYTTDAELEEIKHRFTHYIAWDVAYTANRRSDYNAICVLGLDQYTKKVYVVDFWAEVTLPHKALEKAFELIKKYNPRICGMEVTGGSHDLFRQLQIRIDREPSVQTKLKPIKTSRASGPKNQRIEALEPIIRNGGIIFQKKHKLLLENLEEFPHGKHDDPADVLSLVFALIGLQRKRRAWARKPANM